MLLGSDLIYEMGYWLGCVLTVCQHVKSVVNFE